MNKSQETKQNTKNVVVLAICQALFNSGRTLAFIAASLVAISMLGADLTFVTAPITMMLVGTAAGTLPSAYLMRAWGRKWGFFTGSIVDPKKERQAFYTPPALARLIARAARLKPGIHVLEPSVGEGALVKACLEIEPDLSFDCYDVDSLSLSIGLADVVGTRIVSIGDFLEVEPCRVMRRALEHIDDSGDLPIEPEVLSQLVLFLDEEL